MAGNANSGKRAGGRDFAPRVRCAFDRVLEGMESRKELDPLLLAAMKEDPIGTISKMASYAPKQLDITAVELTPEEWLERMADASEPEGT
jgi:hypothetical protein